MGNDGGSIPTRRELVKSAARTPTTTEVKATQLEALTHAWTICPLSSQTLTAPIVSDHLGTFYNKESILTFLLPSSAPATQEQEALLSGRVKSLKDVVEVKFTSSKEEGEARKWICPITSKELGPATRAVYLVPCGHVFSEVAVREVGGGECGVCGMGVLDRDVVGILPVQEVDQERARDRMRALGELGLTHSLQKVGLKKRKKGIVKENIKSKGESGGKVREEQAEVSHPEQDIQHLSGRSPAATGIKNAATASLTAKVLGEQEERNKRQKLGLNDNLKSLFSNKNAALQATKGGSDFMTRGFSMPRKT